MDLSGYDGARWVPATSEEDRSKRIIGRVHIDVTLRRVADGVVRVHVDDVGFIVHEGEDWWECGAHYWWTEGNAACDCNRELFFARAASEEIEWEPLECTDGRYVVVSPAWLAD